ncbi:MAG TPA: hypothetical protein VGS21_02215, partial [Acidimicrobiales bacterium]|nr:hypothetical protein [Acidimicrobiales bacterium]
MARDLWRRVSAPPWVASYVVPTGLVVVYVAIACLAFWPVEPLSRSHLVGCACSDPVQEAWFLAWPSYALRHGLNPFFTEYLNYPRGINLAMNTEMPLLGVLAAPVIWLRGPVAAFNLLLRASFALSATSMTFVVRRYTRWWPASFAAGLLYGFSPFMVGEGFGHLFLTFAPLPPVIAACLHEICRSDAGRVRRQGLLLGALCVLQYFISIEVLVSTALVCGLVMAGTALRRPRAAWALRGRLARAGGIAAAVFVPLVAYPTWYLLRGPEHVIGPPHSVANLAPLKSDLLSPIVPTLNQVVGGHRLLSIGTSFGGGDRPELGGYLGITLIVLLAYLVVRFRRDHIVLLAAGLTAVSLILSFGSPLLVDGHSSGVPLPFAALVHLPVLQGVVALRFSLFEQMGAALLLGIGLDRLRGPPPAAAAAAHRRAGVVLLIGAAALVPLWPRYPYASSPVADPAYFTSGADSAIPAGSLVLTYPYDVDPVNDAMLWQAQSGMRFRIFGGQASRPGADGKATSAPAALAPLVTQGLFQSAYAGASPARQAAQLTARTYAGLRAFVIHYGVGTVVVDPVGADPGLVVRALTAALGKAPQAI